MIWIFIFIVSCFALFYSGSRLVNVLTRIAKHLGWREFVMAFFIVAFAGALPNIFVGINSALQKMPELSFGEIVGGNVADLTLAVALAILISGNAISVKSKMVQDSAVFTVIIAVLPLALILDNNLSRGDGIVLMLAFLIYIVWLFSKEERFRKKYRSKKNENSNHKKKSLKFIDFLREKNKEEIFTKSKNFLKDVLKTFIYIFFLLGASWGVVSSAQFFAEYLKIPIPIIGILIVGLGNALPETYFAVISAKKGKTWLILGDLMGSVIVCATFVLGLVVLIQPIENINFSPFVIARTFLIVSALLFLLFVRTDRKIDKSEAAILLAIYLIFVFAELAFY